MNFKINNRIWGIREVESNWLKEKYNSLIDDKCTYAYGLCEYPTQTIYINRDMHSEHKIITLKHELMHCWLNCNGIKDFPSYIEEDICNFVAASNDFINEVVEKYKKQMS